MEDSIHDSVQRLPYGKRYFVLFGLKFDHNEHQKTTRQISRINIFNYKVLTPHNFSVISNW